MRRYLKSILLTGLLTLSGGIAQAGSLQLSPTNLEVVAPAASATLTLTNDAKRPMDIQVRVMRWTQINGVEKLEATDDVVASPPFARLVGQKDYLIRVVRVNKAPIQGEESYRLVVDELPDEAAKKSGSVNVLLRYSLPVFFKSPDANPPAIAWSVSRSEGQLVLKAKNNGQTRVRLADLQLSQSGRIVSKKPGLVGYVLGGQVMQWPLGGKISGGPVDLTVMTGTGALDAHITASSR